MASDIEGRLLDLLEELRYKRKKIKDTENEMQRMVTCYHELERVLEAEQTVHRKKDSQSQAKIAEVESKAVERVKHSLQLVQQAESTITQQTEELKVLREQIRSMQVELRRWETMHREQSEKLEQMALRNKNTLEALQRHQSVHDDYLNQFAELTGEHNRVTDLAECTQNVVLQYKHSAELERQRARTAHAKLTELEKAVIQKEAKFAAIELGFAQDKEIGQLRAQIQRLESLLEKASVGEAMAREELEEQREGFYQMTRNVSDTAKSIKEMGLTIQELRKESQMYKSRVSVLEEDFKAVTGQAPNDL